MIEEPDVHELQNIDQTPRDLLVGDARLCRAARVRVGQDHSMPNVIASVFGQVSDLVTEPLPTAA